MQGDQQSMQKFESGGGFAKLEEGLRELALLASLLELLAAISKGAIRNVESFCDLVFGLPPESDLANLFEDAGMIPAGIPRFPFRLLHRTLLMGIHGLGSFNDQPMESQIWMLFSIS